MPGAYSSKRNFLFDLDGTLVNSVPAHERSFVETLKALHPAMAENFHYAVYAGWPTRDVFVALGFRDPKELDELTAHKQRLYRESVERGAIEVFPGAMDLLERLRKMGHRLFLVTGASRASTDRVVKITGLIDYFEDIVTADDAHPGKPAPEPYLHTMARHGLKAEESIVLEDAASGIESARSAGLDVILIHGDFQPPSGVIKVNDFAELVPLLLP